MSAKNIIDISSRSGHTETIAKWISEAITEEGLEVVCKKVKDVNLEELLNVAGMIIGSPTYYGTMSAEIKQFLDASIKYHGKLDGKVGAAFSTAASAGQETTVLSILEGLLVHGMVAQGGTQGYHYGVTALGRPILSLGNLIYFSQLRLMIRHQYVS